MANHLFTQLGLLINESGAITGIEIPISDSTLLADGMHRRVRLKRLTFDDDLEITVLYEMRVFNSDGVDLYDQYGQDSALSPFVKRERMARLQPIEIPRTTRNSFRDALTGGLVASDFPHAVPEIQFFQSMALPHLQAQGLPLTGSEPYLVVVYLMLANIVREKDALNEF